MAILGLVATAASAVVRFAGRQKQYEADKQRHDENAKAASHAAANRYSSQQSRIQQEERQADQKLGEARREALEARSTARVASGEAGVSGLSVDALLQDFSSEEGRYESALDTNLRMTKNYLRNEMKATKDQGIARVHQVPVPTKPSFGAALVNIFSSGIKSYAQFA